MAKKKQWVVCLNMFKRPTTWGYLIDPGQVCYCGPIFSTPFWSQEFLKPVASEEEAEKLVRDEEAKS